MDPRFQANGRIKREFSSLWLLAGVLTLFMAALLTVSDCYAAVLVLLSVSALILLTLNIGRRS